MNKWHSWHFMLSHKFKWNTQSCQLCAIIIFYLKFPFGLDIFYCCLNVLKWKLINKYKKKIFQRNFMKLLSFPLLTGSFWEVHLSSRIFLSINLFNVNLRSLTINVFPTDGKKQLDLYYNRYSDISENFFQNLVPSRVHARRPFTFFH